MASSFENTAPIVRQHTIEGYEVKMTIDGTGITVLRKGDKSRAKKPLFISWTTIMEVGAEKSGTGKSFYEQLGFDE